MADFKEGVVESGLGTYRHGVFVSGVVESRCTFDLNGNRSPYNLSKDLVYL
jgi:hypothetical protein